MMDRSDIADSGSTPEPVAACSPDPIISLIALGEQQFAAGQRGAAIATFQQVIERAPDCARAYNNLAVITWEQKQPALALGYIHKAWNVDPTDPTTVMNYGEMLLAVGQAVQAQQLYQAYLGCCPHDQQVRNAHDALLVPGGDNGDGTAVPVGIFAQQARIDPASVVDDVGREFHWRGGVYRGIAPQATSSMLRLLASRALDEFTEAGLVRTDIAPIVTDEYPLVLAHAKIPFRTYCMEWTAFMLHDAARMLCNLSIVLARHGYCLKDAHPWNIFFDYTRPVFVDFGSIVPLSGFRASWAGEFYRYFLAPLALFSAGEHALARQLLILKADDSLEGIDDRGILRPVLQHYRKLLEGAERHGILWLMYRIGELLNSLQIKQHQGEWSNYDQKPVTRPEEFAPKQRVTHELLQRLPRSTLLDMGANRGWYTKLACSLGYRVAAFDVDDTSVTALYLDARNGRMPVHPFILDFCNPTPAHGRLGLGYPPADERLECDTSLALALVHHLVFKSRLSFAEIAQGIARLTRRRVIVEFIPADDQYVREWMTPAFGWYTLDNFIAAMSVHFAHHSIFESSPAPRCILLFEK